MLNLYQALKSFPPFSRQLICRGMLFTNYDCPQVESRLQMFIEQSYVLYVLSGKRIYHHQKHSWEMTEGSCAFVKKGGIVSEKPKEKEWCVMAFFVPDDFLLPLINDNRKSLAPPGHSQENNDPIIMLDVSEISKSCFSSMLPYFMQSPPPPESLIELKFKELVLSLVVNSANKTLLSYIFSLGNDSRTSIHQVMQNNFSYNLSLSDYAKLCCKSTSTFNRDFKKNFNETPARWVMNKRLDLAKELLENTSLSIIDVGIECGFENPTHFSRVFKGKTGVAPLRFRQKNQNSPLVNQF